MGDAWGLFKEFLGLYFKVFEKYPLAASLTTLGFVAVYILLSTLEKRGRWESDEAWKMPAVISIVGWLIATPILGFLFNLVGMAKEISAPIASIYAEIFKDYPQAAGIVTLTFIVIYLVWRFAVLRWKRTGLWQYPAALLILLWVLVTPVVGLLLTHYYPTSQGSAGTKEAGGNSAEKHAAGDAKPTH